MTDLVRGGVERAEESMETGITSGFRRAACGPERPMRLPAGLTEEIHQNQDEVHETHLLWAELPPGSDHCEMVGPLRFPEGFFASLLRGGCRSRWTPIGLTVRSAEAADDPVESIQRGEH